MSAAIVHRVRKNAHSALFFAVLTIAAVLGIVWSLNGAQLRHLLEPLIERRQSIARFRTLAGVAAVGLAVHAIVGWVLWRRLGRCEPNQTAINPISTSRLEWAWGLLILGLAAAMRIHGLNREYSYDELYTAAHFVTTDSWRDTFKVLQTNNHPLYSLLARLSWQAVGHERYWHGPAEWILRMPAVVFGLSGVYFVWRRGREWVGPGTAMIAATGLAVLPLHVEQSQSARGYAGMSACALLSCSVLLRLLRSPGWSYVLTLTVAGAAAISFHLFGVWVLVIEGLTLYAVAVASTMFSDSQCLSSHSFFQSWIALLMIGVVSFLFYSPMIFPLMSTIASRGSSEPVPGFVMNTVVELLGLRGPQLALLLVFIVIGVVTMAGDARRFAIISVTLFVAPLVIVVSYIKTAELVGRYFSYWLPFAMLLAAKGWMWLWKTRWRLPAFIRASAAAILLALVALWVVRWTVRSVEAASVGDSYRAAVDAAFAEARPETVVCAFGADADLLRYYGNLIRVVHSEAEFTATTADRRSVRCLYVDLPWSSEQDRQLASKLSQTYTVRAFGPVTLLSQRP